MRRNNNHLYGIPVLYLRDSLFPQTEKKEMATKKAVVLTRELKDLVSKRLPSTLSVAETVDGSGNPVLTISDGTPAAGEQVIVLTVKSDTTLFTNVLGAQTVYTPHLVECVMETSTIANVPLVLASNWFPVLGEVLKLGTAVTLYLTANTTVPTSGAGTLKSTWNPNIYHPGFGV
jgi:hypothetical protein